MNFKTTLATLSLAIGMASPILADDLTIGINFEPSVDPQFLFTGNNIGISNHIYDPLVRVDAEGKAIPGLATSWELVDENTWRFTLRDGVTFHDGMPFTAEDVVFSVERVNTIENNPNPYTPLVRSVESVEADGNDVLFHTAYPDPTLPNSLQGIMIVSKAAAEGAGPGDFQMGPASIGTGPYKFVDYKPSEELVVERFDDYWGGAEEWDTVSFRIIPESSARLISLMRGDIDVMNGIELSSVNTIRSNEDLQLVTGPGAGIVYLILDAGRVTTPGVTDGSGNPLDPNPLLDVNVRRALSLAINRDAIAERVMVELADPGMALAPANIIGAGSGYKGETYDPELARELLAQAGYPDGFSIQLAGPSNRYMNDSNALQVIGQMLARIGLDVNVSTEPFNVYFPKIRVQPDLEGLAYSAMLMGWGHVQGDTGAFMSTVLHSYDAEERLGAGNRSGMVDEELDELIETATAIPVGEERTAALGQAMDAALDTYAAIPIYAPSSIAAARAGLNMQTRFDDAIFAMNISPAE